MYFNLTIIFRVKFLILLLFRHLYSQYVLLFISPPYKHKQPLLHNQIVFENTDQDILTVEAAAGGVL